MNVSPPRWWDGSVRRCSRLIPFGSPVILNGQSQLPAMDGVGDTQTLLQILVCQTQQHLKTREQEQHQHARQMAGRPRAACTLPLLMFSEHARRYMGIPMTTSSQAWTAPALHSDMRVFRVSSACWRRSNCSSPSDRLCVRLSVSALVKLWYGMQEGIEDQRDTEIKRHLWSAETLT